MNHTPDTTAAGNSGNFDPQQAAALLDQATVDLPGWAPITITCPDTDLAWSLFELASRARQDALEHAIATPSQRVRRGQQVPTFEFSIASDGSSLGDVTYGICRSCRVGLLYKIGRSR